MQLKQNTTLQNGKYRIIRVLGQGGFGITYLAEHTMLKNKVAIKEFFPKTYCDREASSCRITIGTRSNFDLVNKLKRRFIKEAVNLATFNHPGIVKVIDVFEENNTSYFIMEYIDGESLSEKVKRTGKFTEEEAIKCITEVGEALSHIHSHNISHFDVKPGNIMLRGFDSKPILIDFGLSVQYTQEGDETSTNIGAASPGYAPLEMYDVTKLQSFSPSTDVYSLGATLYYLLTAQVPPTATDIISDGIEFPDYVSVNVVQVIEKAMLTRKKRTQTIIEFLEELGASGNQSDTLESDDEKPNYLEPKTTKPQKTVKKAPRKPVEETMVITAEPVKPKEKPRSRNASKSVVDKRYNTSNGKTKSQNIVIDGIEFVDLGLSVRWANMNVGAKTKLENGEYFVNNIDLNYVGKPTFKIAIPTESQVKELIENCTLTWEKIGGVLGLQFTAHNSNSIFIPFSGLSEELQSNLYGVYWTQEAFKNLTKNYFYISKTETYLSHYGFKMDLPIRLIAYK